MQRVNNINNCLPSQRKWVLNVTGYTMTLQTALETEEEVRYLDSQWGILILSGSVCRRRAPIPTCEHVWALLKWLPREEGDT